MSKRSSIPFFTKSLSVAYCIEKFSIASLFSSFNEPDLKSREMMMTMMTTMMATMMPAVMVITIAIKMMMRRRRNLMNTFSQETRLY